jgi:hypothetical protein
MRPMRFLFVNWFDSLSTANQRPKDSLLAVESDSFQQLRTSFHQLKALWKVTKRERFDRQFTRGARWKVPTPYS